MEEKKEMAMIVPKIFRETATKYSDKAALRYKKYGIWHDISWNEYHATVESLAHALIALGLRKGDRVAVIGDNCPEWVIIDLATLCAGGVTVGIYATNSWDQCQYVINHAEARFYFMENEEQLDKWLEFRDKAPSLEKVILWDLKGLRDFQDPMMMTFNEILEMGRQKREGDLEFIKTLESEITPEDEAMFIYTSGTTGRPKGAVLTHRNIAWIGEAIARKDELLNTDEVLSYLPLCHIFEQIFSILAQIKNGYTVNFIENLDTIVDNMKEISPTVAYAVPRVWEKYHSMVIIKMSDATLLKRFVFSLALKIGSRRNSLMQEGKKVSLYLTVGYWIANLVTFRKLKERLGFERVRLAYSGAAPISHEVISFFNSIGVSLLEGYGQTEGTGVTTVNILGESKVGTVGRPLNGVEIKINDDGEILVKSPGVFKEYHRDPETTSLTLVNGWLHTGDVGTCDEDGRLIITGRKKDIIITAGGKNITPQFIEGKLVFSPYINDAVVIGDGMKYLTALVVLDEDNTVKYAQDNKIQFSTYRDLAQNEEIIKLIQAEVDRANSELSRVEQVKKFTILPYKLYQEEGDVTPTMKVKRKYIQEKYQNLIKDMYR